MVCHQIAAIDFPAVRVLRVRRYLLMEGAFAHMVLHGFKDLAHVGGDDFSGLGELPVLCQSGCYQQVIAD